jgi:hypothetical protein
VVSTDNPYEFIVTESINIVANFDVLDFDTYALTVWDNTFMLDLKILAEKGYEVIDCKWFKNGLEEVDTRTITEFCYSAGPLETDKLELAPTYYMFQLITKNFGTLCSSKKIITKYNSPPDSKSNNLFVYPNPVFSGAPFTIEGANQGSIIYVYNQHGVCVSTTVATDNTATLTLYLPAGIYFIRADNKEIKIVVL